MDISLIQAFKLCHIKDEMVYLRTKGARAGHGCWSEKIRKRLDMRRVKVIGIEPWFEQYGPDYLGMCFTVRGITDDDLTKEEALMMQMK